jgi:hypothetical protein
MNNSPPTVSLIRLSLIIATAFYGSVISVQGTFPTDPEKVRLSAYAGSDRPAVPTALDLGTRNQCIVHKLRLQASAASERERLR